MAYETKRQRMWRLAHEAMEAADGMPRYCPMTGRECVGRRCAAALGREADLTDRLETNRALVAVWECAAYPAKRRVDEAEEPIGY